MTALLQYSPSHEDPAVLDALTVGRSHVAARDGLISAVRDGLDRERPSPQILIGPRGAGKSHTLCLVVHALRSDPALRERVLVLWLPEEEPYPRYADLFALALEDLEAQLLGDSSRSTRPVVPGSTISSHADAAGLARNLRRHRESLARMGDEKALDVSFAALEEAGAKLGRRIVIVSENMQVTMSAPEGGGVAAWAPEWQLRKRLQSARHVQLLAAATTVFGAMAERDAPFYEVFAQWTLAPLTLDEVNVAFTKRLAFEIASGDERRVARAKRLQTKPQTRGRLAAAWVVGGGLPRVVHQLFGVLLASDAMRAESDLKAFFDEVTPYFQGRLLGGQLRPNELRVLDAMVSSDGPATVSELAKTIDASDSVVSTYVRRLCQASMLEPRPKRVGERAARYELTEPLYRPWRRFRRGRGERAQLVFLAEFVAAMMSERELRAEHLAAVVLGVDRPALRVWEEAITLHSARRAPADSDETTASEGASASEGSDEWVLAEVTEIGELFDSDEDEQALEMARRLWEQRETLSSGSKLNVRVAVALALRKCGHKEDADRVTNDGIASCESAAEKVGLLLANARIQRLYGDFVAARDSLQRAEREVVENGVLVGALLLDVQLDVALADTNANAIELDALATRAEELARQTADHRLRSLAAQARAYIALLKSDFDEARRCFAVAIAIEPMRGADGQQIAMELQRAFCLAASGRWAEGLEALDEVERMNELSLPQRRMLAFYRFWTRSSLGRADASEDLRRLMESRERLVERVLPVVHQHVQSVANLPADLCDACADVLLRDLAANSRSTEATSSMVSLLLNLAVRRGSMPRWFESDTESNSGALAYLWLVSRIWYGHVSIDELDLLDEQSRLIGSVLASLSERYSRPAPRSAEPQPRTRALKSPANRRGRARR